MELLSKPLGRNKLKILSPFDNLLINGTLWAIPFGIGMHVLLSDSASGSKLWSGIASLMVIYGVLVYVGDRGEAWLARRKRG